MSVPEGTLTEGFRDEVLAFYGQHFGWRDAWTALDGESRAVELEPLSRGDDGYRAFRVQYLMPLVVEVQFIPND